jgi:uncharacterized protein
MAEERRSPNPGNFAEDRERASRAGRIGGQHSSGNFANDRERAVQAGRKAGRRAMATGRVPLAPRTTQGKFAQDRDRASTPGPGWPKIQLNDLKD